jgi:(p)ppGpp synthase/HD superfamily hydrolase
MNTTNIFSKWSIDKIQDAWQLATRLHDGQKYGGATEGEKIEYINHIGSVVFEILAATSVDKDLDPALAIPCALLHDTLEDTKLTYEELLNQFGKSVAGGVLALTKSPDISDKREKMNDSLKRIKAQPREVWAVKMADRISNLYAPPYYWNVDKKREYVTEARLIHRELKDGSSYLAQRLEEKIHKYEALIGK